MGAAGIAALAMSYALDQQLGKWPLCIQRCVQTVCASALPVSIASDGRGRERAPGTGGDVVWAGCTLAPVSALGTGASLLCGFILVK